MEALKELLSPKTVSWLSFTGNACWIVLGVILSSIFLDMEMNEPRSDFRCAGANNNENDLIQGKCYEQYEKQYNKFGIPLYGFVIFNFFVTAIVCGIYSQMVKSRVEYLETHNPADVEQQAQQGNPPRRKLFKAYCCQLATRFVIGILFIILQTKVLYFRKFPSNFKCSLRRDGNNLNITTMNLIASGNITPTQTYECHNQRATNKTFWNNAVIIVTGIFVCVAFVEVVWILSRAKKGKKFMEDAQFFGDHINLKYLLQFETVPPPLPALVMYSIGTPELPERQQPAWIKAMKESVIKGTERPSDFASPFRRNPGEGDKPPKNLKLDQIYTNLIICCGRAEHDYFYAGSAACYYASQPEDIIDGPHKNILVFGRPGVGKTIFCTKFLRDWATGSVFNKAQNSQLHFKAAFLVKFRRFNSAAELNLRELLANAEFSTSLNDEFWDYILENPTKVLLVFDGIDEFNAKEKIFNGDSDFRNSVQEKMPLHALYNKVAKGKLLNGATVLTTTRPTAASYVSHLYFDRVFEILGFTSQQVQNYVKKFTKDEQEVVFKTIWQHISSNLNIFSLCYIPVNCFIICMCLLHILEKLKSNSPCSSVSLPTKLTDIYSIAIKIFFFKHNDKYRFSKTDDQDIYKPFNKLPEDVKGDFKRLGKIAFDGIKEKRRIFTSDEVEKLEDCGLLHRLPDLEAPPQSPFERPQPQFCFMDLTIQEFLAAKHVTDTMNDAELREFISGHIEKDEWQMVMQFVAGLLWSVCGWSVAGQETSSTDFFTDLLPVSTAEIKENKLTDGFDSIEDLESRTLTCWPAEKDKSLALKLCKCLHEINRNDFNYAPNKLNGIGFNAVDFSDCRVEPGGFLALVDLLKYCKVLCLNLEDNKVGSCCFGIKNVFSNHCELNSLNLSFNGITHEALSHLVEALTHRNCKLSILNLSYNKITYQKLKLLVEALTHSNCKLSSLNLSGNQMINEDVELLSKALMNSKCKLSSLNLSDNTTINEIEHLAKALTHSNCKLRSLNLSGNRMRSQDVEVLSRALMHSNCKLSSLNLSDSGIHGIKITFLVTALSHRNCKLRSLNLSDNGIDNKSAEHLFEALTHSNCKISF